MTQNLHVYTICCRPEVDNDVICSMAVDIKFGVKQFRDIRGADYVMYERTNEHCWSLSQKRKRDRVSPKKAKKKSKNEMSEMKFNTF